MSNYIYIPILNPVHFRQIEPVQLPQYNSRQYGEYHFVDTIQPWEAPVRYAQKVQRTDILYFQFISNFDPIHLQVVDCRGTVKIEVTCIQKLQNIKMPGYYAYECAIAWSSLPDGRYFINIVTGSTIELVSEPIELSETFENTLLFLYFHTRFHEDVIFETGIKFNLRVEGSFGRLTVGSKDQLYEDQKFNTTVLSSKPYTGFKLSIGGVRGFPDWCVEKMNYIWSCNNVFIDGVSYSKISEGAFSLKEEENYPMRAIEMEVRYGVNRGSFVHNPSLNTNNRLGVVYNIDYSRVFGQIPSGSNNIISITGTE